MDLARIQERCNQWYLILNPNKLHSSLVDQGLNPPYGDLVLSGVSIQASSNRDILGVKFYRKLTFEDYARGTVSCVSQRIAILSW